MMPASLQIPALATALALTLLAPACRNSARDEHSATPSATPPQGVENFYNPTPGETWIYRVQREIPVETRSSDPGEARSPAHTDPSNIFTLERRRTCAGVDQPDGADIPLTIMDIYEGDQHRGRELYDINPRGIFSRGWLDTTDHNKGAILSHGVPVALRELTPGATWVGTGRDSKRLFHFRVIEHGEVTVPAGTFDAARIQITSNQPGKGLKRTIWFAENVGIVKEESVYYGPQHIQARERSELINWILPERAATQANADQP